MKTATAPPSGPWQPPASEQEPSSPSWSASSYCSVSDQLFISYSSSDTSLLSDMSHTHTKTYNVRSYSCLWLALICALCRKKNRAVQGTAIKHSPGCDTTTRTIVCIMDECFDCLNPLRHLSTRSFLSAFPSRVNICCYLSCQWFTLPAFFVAVSCITFINIDKSYRQIRTQPCDFSDIF